MSYRFPRHRIHEIVNASKCVSEGQPLEVKSRGEQGVQFDANVDLLDGPYCDMRFLGRAGRKEWPSCYEAQFLLDQQRVRGVGFCAVGRQSFRAKLRIPAGWHQNICDPNMPTDHPEWNRHEPLLNFAPTDFSDFTKKTAALWNIDIGWEKELL